MHRSRPNSRIIQTLATKVLGRNVTVEPVKEGMSTYVYRIMCGTHVFYLRVLPQEGSTFAPEVEVLAILHSHGVLVPEVVYWDDRNEMVARSVMITTEIMGKEIRHDQSGAALPEILRAAGRDLAVINRVPVDGFGWIRRDAPGDAALRADVATERGFMLAQSEDYLSILDEFLLKRRDVDMIQDVVRDHESLLDASHASLAHGDFDATHIFCHQERYTGIIDLGEIRGTGPYYDLGHFRFHDGETLRVDLLPYLLEGYAGIAPFCPDAERRIAFDSLLVGIRFLARTHSRLARHNRLHAIAAIERDMHVLMH